MGRLAWILRQWPWFGVVIGVIGVATYLFPRSPLENIRRRYFDLLKLQREAVVVDDPGFVVDPKTGRFVLDSSGRAVLDPERKRSKIAIVGVDSETSDFYRSSALSRRKVAAAIENLTSGGAAVIAIDLRFEGPDSTASEIREVLDQLSPIVPPRNADVISGIRAAHDPDAALAETLLGKPVTAVFYSPFEADEVDTSNFGRLPPEWRLAQVEGCDTLAQPKLLLLSHDPFVDATRWGGNAFLATEIDGVLRRYPLIARIGDCENCVYPSLGLSAARAYKEMAAGDEGFGGDVWLKCKGEAVDSLALDTYYVPVDASGEIDIDFTGLFDDVFANRVSFWEVAEGKFPANRFEGQLVFIGPDSAFEDTVPTPASRYNGVGIHALAAHALIEGSILQRTARVKLPGASRSRALPLHLVEMASVLLLCGAVTVFFLLFETSQAPLLVSLFLPVAGHVVSKWLLDQGFLVDALTPASFAMVAVFVCAGLRYAVERQERLQEAKRRAVTERELGRFLSPSVVDVALNRPELLLPAKKEISILFSDIRGFTTTAEGMSPEGLVALLDEYLTAMTKIVFAHKGTLDKYIGDAVMALFGAPVDSPEHPELACRTALAMIEELDRLQADWKARNLPVLNIGIGVNTGVVSVGRMGSRVKEEYTCIGDEVNFASRVEGLTKPYGVKILVGENTRTAVGEKFVFRDLGKVKVKGKTKAVRIYELLGTREQMPVNPQFIAVFERGMEAFQAQRWDEADEHFKKAIELRGGEDPPSASLMMWTGIFRKRPPGDDWDGTIERREK